MTQAERLQNRLRFALEARKIQHSESHVGRSTVKKKKQSAIRRRPSDGMPVGSKEFDYEEYFTRKADRKAADPETFAREKAEKKRANREWWDNFNMERAMEAANKGEAGELTCGDKERHRKIWRAVHDYDKAQFANNVFLRQSDRIANTRAFRVRGVGAAARRAGF